MPRAKANPDPAEEEYTSRAGRAYKITAWRSGAYHVHAGGELVASGPDQVNSGFGAPRWPSNRLQADAIARAKNWIEVFGSRPV
jgi:hypothetical protein